MALPFIKSLRALYSVVGISLMPVLLITNTMLMPPSFVNVLQNSAVTRSRTLLCHSYQKSEQLLLYGFSLNGVVHIANVNDRF
jgi:hypothetical protein